MLVSYKCFAFVDIIIIIILKNREFKFLYYFLGYSTFFILGLLFSMQIPFVGFQPVRTSEHMASAGVFILIQAYALLKYLQGFMSNAQLKALFITAIASVAGLVFLGVVFLTYAGYIAPWSGRFYSLWDTGYAKIHIPIIASVSEHQPTTWFSFFFDLHVLVAAFPVGLWYCIKEVNDERVFSKFDFFNFVYFLLIIIIQLLCMPSLLHILLALWYV